MSPVPPPPASKTSGAAIASLVLGICSFFCFIFTAIPGIVCGIIAMRKIDAAKGALAGRGQAIAGLVMSGLSFFLIPVVGILASVAVPALSQARGKAQEAQCLSNLRQIGVTCIQYELESGKPPRALSDLEKTFPGITGMKCPLAEDGESSYEIIAVDPAANPDPGAVVRVRETEPRHRGRRAVAFDDGHVEMKTDAEGR